MRALVLMALVVAATGCDLYTGGDAGCDYGGAHYRRGESFPSTDGCNSCSCTESGVACTEIACVVDAGPACAPSGTCQTGPACGSLCCAVGEACVDGACACGNGAACGVGDMCAAAGAQGGDACGFTCCGASGPCPL